MFSAQFRGRYNLVRDLRVLLLTVYTYGVDGPCDKLNFGARISWYKRSINVNLLPKITDVNNNNREVVSSTKVIMPLTPKRQKSELIMLLQRFIDYNVLQ